MIGVARNSAKDDPISDSVLAIIGTEEFLSNRIKFLDKKTAAATVKDFANDEMKRLINPDARIVTEKSDIVEISHLNSAITQRLNSVGFLGCFVLACNAKMFNQRYPLLAQYHVFFRAAGYAMAALILKRFPCLKKMCPEKFTAIRKISLAVLVEIINSESIANRGVVAMRMAKVAIYDLIDFWKGLTTEGLAVIDREIALFEKRYKCAYYPNHKLWEAEVRSLYQRIYLGYVGRAGAQMAAWENDQRERKNNLHEKHLKFGEEMLPSFGPGEHRRRRTRTIAHEDERLKVLKMLKDVTCRDDFFSDGDELILGYR